MSHRLVVKSDEERLVYAEVYSPLHIDTDGEAMTAESIRKMAHNFLANGRVRKIDVQHNQKESGCEVVESFLAKKDDPDGFIDGSWVLGVHVIPDEVWNAVKKGELNGLSFFGAVMKVPARANVIVTRKMVGDTEESLDDGPLPAHSHGVTVDFSTNGRVLEGITDKVLDHQHKVTKATATDMELDHAHRLILIENEMFKAEKGGASSGNFGHEGREGEVGGSVSSLSHGDYTVDDKVSDADKESVKNWGKKAAGEQAYLALDNLRDGVVLREGGEIVAVASGSASPWYFSVDHLGSNRRGGGTAAMYEMAKRAVAAGSPKMLLKAEVDAIPFYKKLGLKADGYQFEWKASKMKSFIRAYESSVKAEDEEYSQELIREIVRSEPKSGLFVASAPTKKFLSLEADGSVGVYI